jgi:hypothetical protein
MTDYVAKAREALKQPDSYFSSELEDEGVWGRIGIGFHRDSTVAQKAVTDAIAGELLDRYGNDFKWIHSSHWAHGWSEELLCRVMKNDAIYPPQYEDELTEAFIYAVDMAESFDISHYETVIVEAEHEETLNNIEHEWPAVLTGHSEEDINAVWRWLIEHDIEPGGDDGTWYSRDEIALAGFHLNLWDMAWAEDEWYEMVEQEGIANALQQYTIALHNTSMF